MRLREEEKKVKNLRNICKKKLESGKYIKRCYNKEECVL
jgi:hypothetical protein